jgi:hypothetical protein
MFGAEQWASISVPLFFLGMALAEWFNNRR